LGTDFSSHLLWLGTYLLDLGAYTPFFYCFDDRERILDILEHVTGERLTYDYFRFGGLERDIPQELIQNKVHQIDIVNDRGIHICQSMIAYQKWGKKKDYSYL